MRGWHVDGIPSQPEAREDFFEAAEYHEAREEGLGSRFRDEISKIVTAVSAAPYLWREPER
jgi:hypothetical protein